MHSQLQSPEHMHMCWKRSRMQGRRWPPDARVSWHVGLSSSGKQPPRYPDICCLFLIFEPTVSHAYVERPNRTRVSPLLHHLATRFDDISYVQLSDVAQNQTDVLEIGFRLPQPFLATVHSSLLQQVRHNALDEIFIQTRIEILLGPFPLSRLHRTHELLVFLSFLPVAISLSLLGALPLPVDGLFLALFLLLVLLGLQSRKSPIEGG
mmetsp:Transcript_24769/g.48438  ORF Transcript_24769/g.48438 Transcript_24769/m.48438 type:complete len:208 (-) Transcript_24769:58-681(-)